jgi:hypothetical protein
MAIWLVVLSIASVCILQTLQAASLQGHISIVEKLLSASAHVNARRGRHGQLYKRQQPDNTLKW